MIQVNKQSEQREIYFESQKMMMKAFSFQFACFAFKMN